MGGPPARPRGLPTARSRQGRPAPEVLASLGLFSPARDAWATRPSGSFLGGGCRSGQRGHGENSRPAPVLLTRCCMNPPAPGTALPPGAHGVSRPWCVTPQTHPRAAECLCPHARPTKHVCRTEWGRPLFRKAQAGKRSGPLRASGLCREDSALPHEVATGDVHTSGPGHVPTSLTRGHGNLKK